MRRSICCTLLFSFCIVLPPAYAGGSIYSRYGIGDLLTFSGGRSYSFGGAAAALIGDGFINRLNPAGVARIQYTRFSAGFEYTQLTTNADAGSVRDGIGRFQGAAFAIPIDTANGIVLTLESTPYSSVNYSVTSSQSTDIASSTQTFFGKGGISSLAVGSSVTLVQNVHAGAKLSFLYGRTRQYSDLDFATSGFADSEFDRSRYYSGFGFTGGLLFENVGSLLNMTGLNPLSLGIVYQPRVSMDVRDEEYIAILDSTIERSGSMDLPASLVIGASYKFTDRYLVTADVQFQDWSTASTFGTTAGELQALTRFAGGLEIAPERTGTSFFGRTLYRFGAYHSTGYVQLNGSDISETGFTAGLGLPISPESRLNLGLQLGFRGTTSNGLLKDTIVRFSLGISASELWFMTFEEE